MQKKYFIVVLFAALFSSASFALEPLVEASLSPEQLKKARYIDSSGKILKEVRYKRTAQQDLHLDFYYPNKDLESNKPVVIFTHGGGWAAGNKYKADVASFRSVHKKLLAQGFCVASVQYRLCGKDGQTRIRDCVIDAKDAVRFLSAHHEALGIDPQRFFTFGDSAGGHLAQMLLFSPAKSLAGDPELAQYDFKMVAGVSWYGPCDFENPQLFNANDNPNFRDRFGARILGKVSQPEEKAALYKEMSPVNYVTADSPPLLMMQGDKDTTIPVKHAYRMQEKIAEVAAPVEIVIVKNAGHNWRDVDAPIEPNRNQIISQTVDFFLKHK